MTLPSFLLGAVAMASLVAALFFYKFWRRTQDRFFLLFSLAFVLDAVNRSSVALLSGVSAEHEPIVYLLRLVSFGLILGAILDKNLRGRRK